jgi:hypothetical protein
MCTRTTGQKAPPGFPPRAGLLFFADQSPTLQSSLFRGVRSTSPESILTIVVMDSGLAPSGAPRNDDGWINHDFTFPRRGCARVLQLPCPSTEQRAQGRPGARAPAVSCASCTKKGAHEHTGSAETLRPSPRNGFTAYIALSLVTGFLATIAPRTNALAFVREKRLLLKGLDASIGAPEPHDFAVRVGAVRQERRHVHRISPRVRDDREPPLIG